jgi:superfamily II DNA or RNA helicase
VSYVNLNLKEVRKLKLVTNTVQENLLGKQEEVNKMQIKSQKRIMPNVFQQEALKKLEETKEKRGVVVMPTGTGKTFLAVLWFKRILENNKNAKLIFICHNQDILSQANTKEFQQGLKEFEIDYGYYNAKEKDIKQVTFATTQTLTRSLNKFDKEFFDYVIVDESHHYQAKSFKKVVEYFNPKFLLGLTATPNRSDNKSIFKILGKKIYEERVSSAIKKGLLTKINYWCVDNDIDFKDVKWNGNNYDEKDLNRKICIKEYDDAILKEYKETLRERFGKSKTICFCATVEHTHRMAKLFNENGIKAVGLTGTNRLKEDLTPRGDREKIVNGFRKGKYDIIFVRDLFNEGVDVPDCDSIMMLRPTQSHTIFTQQIGRGLRKSEGKEDVLILDFTGNARKCVINFESLGEMIELDIIEKIKSDVKERNQNQIEFINLGCKVRLNQMKVDIITNRGHTYNINYLIDRYYEIKKKLGRTPKSTEMSKPYGRVYLKRFGSWNNFLKSIGESIDKKDIMKRYFFELKKKLGRSPTKMEIFNKFGTENISSINYKDFLKKIGQKHPTRNKPTKEELIKEFKEFKIKYCRSPLAREVKDCSFYHKEFWGSWNNFLRAIGEQINCDYEKCSKEDIIKEYFRIKNEKNIQPTLKMFNCNKKYGVRYNSKKIEKLFGSWTSFLKSINEPLNQNNVFAKDVTKKELIDNFYKFRDKIGRSKFKTNMLKVKLGSKFGITKYISKFGSMAEFCNQIGEDYRVMGTKNIKIISQYKPKTIIPIKPKQKGNKNKTYEGLVKSDYSNNSSKEDKIDIRERILSKIKDGDKVLLLESPDLTAIKEIEKRGINPKKIVIPNHLEFNKLAQELRNYKTNLNIECINTSALQYLVDSEEKFDFIWLDYCGAFSYYMKDLDILFAKHFGEMKLILTYNLFDPAKDDENYYFTRVIDYVLDKISGKSKIRLINDVTYRYKKNMYNIGFEIKQNEGVKDDGGF